MAVAAPARKAAPAAPPVAPARPAPSRRRPLRPTRTAVATRGAAAPARKAAPSRAPARKAPTRKSPSRKAPARKKPVANRSSSSRARAATLPQRAVAGGQLIPIAVGRTAVAVRQLPDSGLVVRMTRGRAWIAVLGLLLVGIVALNVITLSFAASAGQIDGEIRAVERDIGVTEGRDARLSGTKHVRDAAGAIGLNMPTSDQIQVIEASSGDATVAAQRLAAMGG